MKIIETKSEIETKELNKKSEPVQKIFAGLVFPSGGIPFYYCVVVEKPFDRVASMEEREPILQIVKEGQAPTISELKKELKKFEKLNCQYIYIENKKEFWNYIKEIVRWRAEEKLDIHFRPTRSVSFESSIMKIKEFIMDKRLSFPEESLIKTQLAIFSKSSFKQEDDFYAVKSLCLVIESFKKNPLQKTEKVPDQNSWW